VSITTHVSAGRRRRQRLRRTASVLVVLVAGSGALSYAVWHEGNPPHSAREAVHAAAPAAAAVATPSAARRAGTDGFAPVVTDHVPEPTTSIALSAPVPGTTNMQQPAAEAFRAAFAGARAAGLDPAIRSAWRSAEYQQVLFDRAVRTYGSESEAARWVLSPNQSAHVKGYAVDVQPRSVATWLEAHGSRYGLCRTYDNEWWHFEYLANSHCPPRLPSAADAG
jgi:LAS superfamily LD-carboxypeptidase LdcB